MKHTPAPWHVTSSDKSRIRDKFGPSLASTSWTKSISREQSHANAARIVAAVNFTEGIPNEALADQGEMPFAEALKWFVEQFEIDLDPETTNPVRILIEASRKWRDLNRAVYDDFLFEEDDDPENQPPLTFESNITFCPQCGVQTDDLGAHMRLTH